MAPLYVLPVGRVDAEALMSIETGLRVLLNVAVTRLAALPEPEHAYNAARSQYNSALILRQLLELCPAGALRLLAVTEKDLFIPMLTFVFGQAQVGGKLALVSLARLRQEFYGLESSAPLLHERALKESLHELGHTFELFHCLDATCLMSVSTGISQVDLKSGYCASCAWLLHERLDGASRGEPASSP